MSAESVGGQGRRTIVLVHAHPDDETLTTGITMAVLRRAGHRVHVITCTLGEEGEVIPPELAHLAPEHGPGLGVVRREELRTAMAVLGVEHEVLGEQGASAPGRTHRDSGMAGTSSADHPDAFVSADVTAAAAQLRSRLVDLAAQVVVTYDEHGGYAHPDHIQTHRVTVAAVSGMPPSERPDLYAVLTPRGWATEDRQWLAESYDLDPSWTVPAPGAPWPPSIVDDGLVTHRVLAPELVPLQQEALTAHRTQVSVGRGCYALSNGVAARLAGREGFALLDPTTGGLAGRAGEVGPRFAVLPEVSR